MLRRIALQLRSLCTKSGSGSKAMRPKPASGKVQGRAMALSLKEKAWIVPKREKAQGPRAIGLQIGRSASTVHGACAKGRCHNAVEDE